METPMMHVKRLVNALLFPLTASTLVIAGCSASNDTGGPAVEGTGGGTNLNQAFFLEWQAFLDQCRSRAPSLVDATSALLSTRFIEAAYANGAGATRL